MADQLGAGAKENDKVAGPDSGSGDENTFAPEPGGMSLEELDQILKTADPNFEKSLTDIQSEEAKSELNIELIDIEQVLATTKSKSFNAKLKRAGLYLKVKLIWLFNFLKTYSVHFAIWFWGQLKSLGGFLKFNINRFLALPIKLKLGFLGILALVAFTGFFVFKALTTGWIHEAPPPFLQSLEQWSKPSDRYEYAPDEVEPFYQTARITQNIFNLKKMVVNIRRSENSGTNPMAAFEFFLEGNSLEVVVEVKDRESEVRDMFQRMIEEMSYDQLASSEGKQSLQEKLRREINKILTAGLIRKVYIKDVIIKP